MKKMILATMVTFALASPAFANHCPKDMAKIDAAMKTAMVDEATKNKVMDLYNKGKSEHEMGNHAASEKTLAEAMKLLGIS